MTTASAAPRFDNTYARLPTGFHAPAKPQPVRAPRIIRVNYDLCRVLGLDPAALESDAGAQWLAGNQVPEGAEPIALAYAGHQFGNFVPQLGDGRALLLGEVVGTDGVRRDLQLKGTGTTPFSRGGDGRAPIGPVVREYLASEAMHALGVRTTRALAAVETGESVLRHAPEPGGILARVATSHVRVGTFEYFARRGDDGAVRELARYVLHRHYPELAPEGEPGPAEWARLLEAVIEAQAGLIADWMGVGFIHGVMNTDNTSVVGETIDYGPFGFLDTFDPGTVYSSIDQWGRYAYDQQPRIAQWNLARLAEAFVPLLATGDDDGLETAQALLDGYGTAFEQAWRHVLTCKIGLAESREGDVELAFDWLDVLERGRADFTLAFRALSRTPADGDATAVRALFANPEEFDGWLERYRTRLAQETRPDADRMAAMQRANPAYILRNHLAQWAVDAATASRDYEPMERLLGVLSDPWREQPGADALMGPPAPEQRVTRTFCGT